MESNANSERAITAGGNSRESDSLESAREGLLN